MRQIYILALTRSHNRSEYFLCDHDNLHENFIFLLQRNSEVENDLLCIEILKPNNHLSANLILKQDENDEINFNLENYVKSEEIIANSEVLFISGGEVGLKTNVFNNVNLLDSFGFSKISYGHEIEKLKHIISNNVQKYSDAYLNFEHVTMAGEFIASEYFNAIKQADHKAKNLIRENNLIQDNYHLIIDFYIRALEDAEKKIRENISRNKEEYSDVLQDYVKIKDNFIMSLEQIRVNRANIKKLGEVKSLLHDSRNSQQGNNSSLICTGKNQFFIGLLYYFKQEAPNNLEANYFICDTNNFTSNLTFWINRYNNTELLACSKIVQPDTDLGDFLNKNLDKNNNTDFNLLNHKNLEYINKHSFLVYFFGGILGTSVRLFNTEELNAEIKNYKIKYRHDLSEKSYISEDLSHYLENVFSNESSQEVNLKTDDKKRKMSESHTSDYLDVDTKSQSKLTDDNEGKDEDGESGKEGFKP